MLEYFKFIHYATIGSTNDVLKDIIRQGKAEEGLVIWADQQTQGRGRYGRKWEAPLGNLYASLLTKPQCSLKKAGELSFVAAVSIGQTLESLLKSGYDVGYKWPNDIMVAYKKIAGILLEKEGEKSEDGGWLIIGIGLNVDKAPLNLSYPAIAFHEVSKGRFTPYQLLEGILANWQKNFTLWYTQGFARIRCLWEEKALGKGQAVHIKRGKEQISGRFLGLDPYGSLILKTVQGGVLSVSSGEVFFKEVM